jgi:alpha-glucoside transport system permease protein
MMTTASDRVPGPAVVSARPAGGDHGPADTRRRAQRERERRTVAFWFTAPAVAMLIVLVCYPIGYTVWRSLHSASGANFVGLDNYRTMFTSPEIRRAIVNNAVWVVVAPSVVTTLGLIFAVMTDKVRRATFFKTVLFMPMAISFLAAGVTWRLVYDNSPDRGALNAAVVAVHDIFAKPSLYHGANPRPGGPLTASADGGFQTAAPVGAGEPVELPLVGLAQDRIPAAARPASAPAAGAGLSGVVWLDFTRGGGGQQGVIDPGEPGLPEVTVQAMRGASVVASTTTDPAGRFWFTDLTGTGYTIRLAGTNFAEPFHGLSWLGPGLITPALMGAYIWIWAGFAMVVISAGLAAMPREALDAARVDGATEWQVLTRVTVPMVRPVLVVVAVTLITNVLKIFDLVYVLSPESSQRSANVVALEMYRVSFGGGLDYGLGSALAVLLFVLVLPAMVFNIRRLKRNSP